MGAPGNSSASESSTFSPPRIPVSQSWTSATRAGTETAEVAEEAGAAEGAEMALPGLLRGSRGRDGAQAEDLHVSRVDGLHGTRPAELLHPGPAARRQLAAQSLVSEHPFQAVRDVLRAVGIEQQRGVADHLRQRG